MVSGSNILVVLLCIHVVWSGGVKLGFFENNTCMLGM
jgi:hypothetical protein